MKKTFIVCVDASAPVEERDGFTKHLRASQIPFWHHVDHLWIVAAQDENLTAQVLHGGVREFIPNGTSMVLEVEVKDYHAFCTQIAHTWLFDHLRPYSGLAKILAETIPTDQ